MQVAPSASRDSGEVWPGARIAVNGTAWRQGGYGRAHGAAQKMGRRR